MKRFIILSGVLLALAWSLPVSGDSPTPVAEARSLAGISGGLFVHLDCGDGLGLSEIAQDGRFLAHGLARDEKTAAAIRRKLASEGLLGLANAEPLAVKRLPYADNLVNLLVAEDLPGLLAKGLPLTEVVRVLCPNGSACLGVKPEARKEMEAELTRAGISDFRYEQKTGSWLVFSKPRPAGMDDWTHWNHGPDGNLVSKDMLIERPNRIQWIAGPHWQSSRGIHVPGVNSPSSMRSANGRNYYLTGDLVARDAFNGVMLWSKDLRSVPDHLIIASGNEVYLVREGKLVALDGATGKDLRSYGTVENCRYLLLVDGLLLSFESKALRAFDAATGAEKWTSPAAAGAEGPVAEGGRLFCTRGEMLCLSLADGKELWKKDTRAFGQVCFAAKGRLLLRTKAQGTTAREAYRFTALSATDGTEAWSYTSERAEGFSEVFFADGLVWIQGYDDRAKRDTKGFHNPDGGVASQWFGLDPETGKVRRTMLTPVTLPFVCHPLYATERFFIGNRPVYFTSWKDGSVTRFEATRMDCGSTCGLGQGMFFGLYTNSGKCMCVRHAISGISAYDSDRRTIDGAVDVDETDRWVQGPATPPETTDSSPDNTWPQYRYDARRTASVKGKYPQALTAAWEKKLLPGTKEGILHNDWVLNKVTGDNATQPTVASGRVFVSLTHAQQVVALDEGTGETLWTFCAPGRLDAPPSVGKGMCLVGCHDGWVYGLRADNGQQVWRFRAAPAERRMVAYGQVESAWPVTGGVLLAGDLACVVAGRTTETDGGLYVHALDVTTGKPVWSGRRVKPDDGPIGAWNLRGLDTTYFGPADLLVSDGKSVAIAGHSRGHFDLKSGNDLPGRSFDGPHLGWMLSRYATDNQHLDYPPLADFGDRTVSGTTTQDRETGKKTAGIAMTGKPAWTTALPDLNCLVDGLATAGNPETVRSVPPPTVRITAVREAPVIDGKIDDLYTRSATPLNFTFLNGEPGVPREKTTAYVLSDTKYLYLAFRCETTHSEELLCKKTKRDDDIWADECVEMYIDPQDTRGNEYFHIIVNPAGVTQDARAGDASWNPAVEVRCGKEDGKAWIAEIRIPFEDVGVKAGNTCTWSFNLTRSARDPVDTAKFEDTAWSPTGVTSSHVPSQFGYAWVDALQGALGDKNYAAWFDRFGSAPKPTKSSETPEERASGVVAAAFSNRGSVENPGEVWLLAVSDGKKLASARLPAGPVFDGLALANGKTFVSLQDGTVICFTSKP